jgi:ABC-type nitrate/sulfonate/bicarbonate transport system substrate-binding protein
MREIIFILLVLLGLSAPSVAWSGTAAQKIKLAYAVIGPDMAGLWMAKESRTFEKYGLSADLLYISSGGIAVQAMLGGDLDMALGASNAVVSAIVNGAPLIAVAANTNRAGMTLWVQPEIAKVEQLKGKILGITRPGSVSHFLSVVFLEKYGLKDEVKLQPFGGNREASVAFNAAMMAGRLSATRPGPKAHALLYPNQLGIPYSQALLAVKRDFYRSSPHLVSQTLKAYIEGLALMRTRKDQALKVMHKYMGVQGEALNETYEYAVTYLARVPKVDPATVQNLLEWLGKPDAPVNNFFDNRVLETLEREGFIDRIYGSAAK